MKIWPLRSCLLAVAFSAAGSSVLAQAPVPGGPGTSLRLAEAGQSDSQPDRGTETPAGPATTRPPVRPADPVADLQSAVPFNAARPAPLPFATLDEARLFTGSGYGQQLLDALEEGQRGLAAENRIIEAGLAAREEELTRKRGVLSPADFRIEADKFNEEVEAHRRTQAEKERRLYLDHDAARQNFRLRTNEVLIDVMRERGIAAIISDEAVILGFRDIDITEDVIARMDKIADLSEMPVPGIDPEPAPPASPELPLTP